MSYEMIIIGVIAILVVLSFIKTLSKIVFFLLLACAGCIVLMGMYGISPLGLLGI